MKNRIKNLVASAALSAALVFGAAATSSAYHYDWGDFSIGIMGTTVEMGIEMGNIDYNNVNSPTGMYHIPVNSYTNLFDINDVAATFAGDTLEELSLAGYASSTDPYTGAYRGYFAVQKDFLPMTEHTAISSFDAATVNAGGLHDDSVQGGWTMAPVGDRSIKWGLADGTYNLFLDDLPQPGRGQYGDSFGETDGLINLASGGIYEMDIWFEGDDNYAYGQNWDEVWDYPLMKTDYVLRLGADENGMVWVETVQVSAVPVPAAVWLLGSGFLAMMGLRRKNS